MTQPQTFREAREQLDKLNEEWADGNGGISERRYDEDRNELDTQIAAMVHGKEDLLDAATELLEALEALMEFWDNDSPVYPGSLAVHEAREALAKAKGESP